MSSNRSATSDRMTLDTALVCPRCGYDLRGSSGLWCPECSTQTTWNAARAAARDRLDAVLFEYARRNRPVRALMRTLFWPLAIRRFWRRLAVTQPPRLAALFAFGGTAWVLYAALNVLAQLLWWFAAARILPAGPPTYAAAVRWQWGRDWRELLVGLSWLAIVWLACNACSQLWREKRIAGQVHLLRLLVYSVTVALLVRWTLVAASMGLDLISLWMSQQPVPSSPRAFRTLSRAMQWVNRGVVWAPALVFFALFARGCSSYLRLRFGWLWGLVVLALAIAIQAAVLFAVSMHVYGSLDNTWTRLAGSWQPYLKPLLGQVLEWQWAAR